MYLRPGRRYHAVSPALGCHLAFIGWMNPWSLRGVFPDWGIYDLLLKLHIHQQLWELTRLQPELSRAGPHLLQPSLPSQPPSGNSLGWAFCSLVPRQCSWCCRLGRGRRTKQKVCRRELSLSSKGEQGWNCPLLPT